MIARIVVELHLTPGTDLGDVADLANQAAALLLHHRDHRIVEATAVAAENVTTSNAEKAR